MSCCITSHERGCRRSGDGYLWAENACHHHYERKFCMPIVKRVTCIKPACDCKCPVEIEVTGLWNELAANNCFELIFCGDTLQQNSVSPVVLIDADHEQFLLMEGFTGNSVKYDQLCKLVDRFREDGWRDCPDHQVRLLCYYANSGPKGHELHIMCEGCLTDCGSLKALPASTFVPDRREGVHPHREESV